MGPTAGTGQKDNPPSEPPCGAFLLIVFCQSDTQKKTHINGTRPDDKAIRIPPLPGRGGADSM